MIGILHIRGYIFILATGLILCSRVILDGCVLLILTCWRIPTIKSEFQLVLHDSFQFCYLLATCNTAVGLPLSSSACLDSRVTSPEEDYNLEICLPLLHASSWPHVFCRWHLFPVAHPKFLHFISSQTNTVQSSNCSDYLVSDTIGVLMTLCNCWEARSSNFHTAVCLITCGEANTRHTKPLSMRTSMDHNCYPDWGLSSPLLLNLLLPSPHLWTMKLPR